MHWRGTRRLMLHCAVLSETVPERQGMGGRNGGVDTYLTNHLPEHNSLQALSRQRSLFDADVAV